MGVVFFYFFVIILFSIFAISLDEKRKRKKKLAEQMKRQEERAARERERKQEAELRRQAKEESRRAAQREKELIQESKRLEREHTAAEKATARLNKSVIEAASISALCDSLPKARADFKLIDKGALSKDSLIIYENLENMLSCSDSRIVDQYIINKLEELRRAALAPISVEAYARIVNKFFSDMKKSCDYIPIDTRDLLEDKMKELGVVL